MSKVLHDHPFEKGNQYWRLAKCGAKRKFPTPESLLEKCIEYFEWVEANPMEEPRAAHHQGTFVQGKMKRPRAMTIVALSLYIGMTRKTWMEYREREDYKEVCEWVEDVIWTQKFEGAAAEMFNIQIIARELGLAEKTDITSAGKSIRNDWTVMPTSSPEKDGKDKS